MTVVTANHYWVDAALGWMVAGLSFLIATRVVAQIKPETWAWSRAADEQRSERLRPPWLPATLPGASSPPRSRWPASSASSTWSWRR